MLDELDRALVHALRVDGRAPFSRIAAVLDVSPQTVARRYRRLRAEAGLRVVGLADPHRAGRTQWLLRLTAGPHTALNLAQALVRRPDTAWVKLASGGTEITAIVDTGPGAAGHTLLLRDIPRSAAVTAVSAHCLLHTYRGGPSAWPVSTEALTDEQQALLHPAAVTSPSGGLDEADHALLGALHRDGRTPLGDLAAATGRTPATVARRLAELRSDGTVFLDIELDARLLGAGMQALLWLSVAPAHLDRVGRVLATHRELAFVAATTGPSNLAAFALCTDPADLHRYLTQRLGAVPEIAALETAPVLRTLKAAGPVPAPPVRGLP
ncbi:DNA-binding Lrp family transcriptional regulator [Streptomyces sp. 1114.5]|uniref:Lrp/AsnC family transcriptional regulator n=1 Tax=unclassified Streptomyces TaxID=2593676 RepID=UPI000BC3D23D|nr:MULTISPECIES: AsnC family transcriptional regulator [unclassified Streptomyces]RKT11449.1 DNA-binding Lrp family transcriptional regulator [Streptomyces sp. 1114.5]SOB81181.1 DNA-binding transcriptional regulator, Lrp family [Streptomyces sp. 1331.2]